MRKALLVLALIFGMTGLARAQQKWTLSAAGTTCTTSNTVCLIYLVDAASGGATFTVSANAGGNTLQFEATGDGGTTWVALNATPSNSTTAATSTTSTGTWQANVAGYTAVRIRMSTLSSGTSTVSIITSLASARSGGGGGAAGVTSITGDGTIITNVGSTGAVTLTADTTTGTGSIVLATSPALTTPNLGTPSAITLTNATGYNFPLTVAGTVTSGGIPCFDSTTDMKTSVALLANNVPKGGGAGGCPGLSTITDNGTTVSTTEPIATSAAGTTTNPALSATGAPVTGGTGTTTIPLAYFNSGTAPSSWSTSGTVIGVNSPSGFGGNAIDIHLNGGGSLFSVVGNNGSVNSQGVINLGSGNYYGWTSQARMYGVADGVIRFTNNAATGYTRLAMGPDTTAFPAFCPQTGTTPYLAIDVASACTTGSFVKTAQTLQVTAADVTCGTSGTLTPCTAFTTITGLSVALPTVATTWSFSCDLIVSQATAAAADQIGVQTATNASTNLAASGFAYTAAAVSTAAAFTGASSTTAQSIVTFTPGATGTKLPVHVSGTVEGTSTSGTTFNLQVLTGSAADLLTIYRGSACWVW